MSGAQIAARHMPWRLGPALDARFARLALLATSIGLALFLLAPLATILVRCLEDANGDFVGLEQFAHYLLVAGLGEAIWNTLWVSLTVTLISVPAAFAFAYGLQRSCLPGKGVFRLIGLSPLLGPSLVAAISLIQWFGNQGALRGAFTAVFGEVSIYGPPGIILAAVYATFPHALMILTASLATADARLFDAADALGASRWRRFTTVTLPGAKFGIISAAMVVFSYTVADFGIPKVIGGNFRMLAVEVYQQVIGQQNFNRGAVVAVFLLAPAVLAFIVDWRLQQKSQATLTARAVPFSPRPDRRRDVLWLSYCLLVSVLLLAVIGMAVYTSVVKFWPYNLELTLRHYTFGLDEAGVGAAYFNSLKMATLTAVFGTGFIFMTAWLLERTRGFDPLRPVLRLLVALPMAVPGLVLGLGYVLFFNAPGNPVGGLYQTMTIMVVANIVHYYTSCHLTATTALKSIDREFESVSASLKVSIFTTLGRVTLPVCLPSVLEIGRYLFVNAMTTVSALVFLYSPATLPAAVSILNLDEAGEIGPAAAMATLIIATSTVVCIVYSFATRLILQRSQAWRLSNPTTA